MNQVLLVEGKDDQHVLWALCQKFALPQNFKVIDADGIDNLLIQLPVRLKAAKDRATIGIIVDADEDLTARWNQVYTIFKSKLNNFPNQPAPNGIIHVQNNIKVGVWVMPNNLLNGSLEDFIEFLIPKADVLLPVVEQHLTRIETRGINPYKLIHKSKAKISSWLAIQESPGTPMGLSITKRYLTTDGEECERFINWLRALYQPKTDNF